MWWDEQELSWSSAGCEVSSTSTILTTCHCKHLTNFGIMFDYTGDADASDPYLNILTYILLTISSLSILATQVQQYSHHHVQASKELYKRKCPLIAPLDMRASLESQGTESGCSNVVVFRCCYSRGRLTRDQLRDALRRTIVTGVSSSPR